MPKEEDVASEARRLRASGEAGAPILVFGSRVETRVAQTALLAGADAFVYIGTRPAQIVEVLRAASRGETLVPRDLLEAFLDEMVSREDLPFLTARQREFLELVAALATSRGEIVVPTESLKAFLEETTAARGRGA